MNFKMGWSIKLVAVGFLVAVTHSFAHAGGLAEDCSVDSTSSACNAPGTDVGNYTSEGSDLAGPQTVVAYPTTPQNNPTTTDPVFTTDSIPAYPSVDALVQDSALPTPGLPTPMQEASLTPIQEGAVTNPQTAAATLAYLVTSNLNQAGEMETVTTLLKNTDRVILTVTHGLTDGMILAGVKAFQSTQGNIDAIRIAITNVIGR